MAQLYSTGPAYIYVSAKDRQGGSPLSDTGGRMKDLLDYPAKNTIFFLGTCERPPIIKIIPSFIPVRADIGGVDPFDQLFGGETALTTILLNRWNEEVYEYITKRPIQLKASAPNDFPRGRYMHDEIGMPMLGFGPGRAFCLWVQFPYSAQKPLAYGAGSGNQPDAYRFPGTILLGPDDIQAGSPSKRALIFWSGKVYNRTDGTWTLYDHAVEEPGSSGASALPQVPPTDSDGGI